MNLKSIISVTGKPGLFKVVSQTKNGLIVESINDKKRLPVYASDKVSALEDISIYTIDGDILLSEVYDKLFAKTAGKKAIDHKSSPEELRNYLKEIIENFDQERVYHSDLKKLFQWFNTLIDAGLLKPEKESAKEKKDTEKKEAKPKATKPKTTKKPAVKKSAPKTSVAKGGAKTTTPSKKGK